MPRRYHRVPEFRRERVYVLLFLPACTLVTCVSLVLADVYRVPGLARACTMHSCVTREGFRLRVNLQKNACSWLCVRDTCNFKHGYSAREHQV